MIARLAIVALFLLSSVTSAEEKRKKPVEKLIGASIFDIKLMVDTFKTVQQKLGTAEMNTVEGKDDDHPPLNICYRTQSGQVWLWFQSGSAGDWTRIDTLTMAGHARRGDEQCTELEEKSDEPAYGRLKIGMKRKQIEQLLGKGICEKDACRFSETKDALTFSIIIALKDDAIDSMIIWQDTSG